MYTADDWYECLIYVPQLRKNINDICPLRDTEPETVSHFILKCPQFSFLRDKLYDNVSSHSPVLKNNNEMTQLKYFLDLQCPPDTVKYCYQCIEISTASDENVISNVVNAQMLANVLMLMYKRRFVCTIYRTSYAKWNMLLSPFMYTGGGIFFVCCVSLFLVKLASVQVVLIKSWILYGTQHVPVQFWANAEEYFFSNLKPHVGFNSLDIMPMRYLFTCVNILILWVRRYYKSLLVLLEFQYW